MDTKGGIRLGFLGGASAIGASCVYVQVGGLRVVVDGGVRQTRGETLPDLRALQETLGADAPDAIVLTHAHLDHSGALPVLVRSWPGVPVLATPATADLVRILLLDSLKIMEFEREEEVPLFSAEEAERALATIRIAGFDDPVDLPHGRVRLLPAGHILGAAAALLEVGPRRVLVSGDVSLADQRTVPGMPLPPVRPDVMVLESTYGNRLHASRAAEERRLVDQVAQTVREGGHVLVPAFAVGRAQEVLLILQAAMRAGRIPPFPVYADGMVRAACDAYRGNPLYLGPRLRRAVLRGTDPFFPAKAGPGRGGAIRVTSPDERRRVIEGPPCCVVASSGMLAGGASPVYASAWAGDPANRIAITGYQDEEAPGRALLDLAAGTERRLRLGGRDVDVRAQVAAYHLSAHADGDELAALVRRLRPRAVYLVHGERAAREALAERLAAEDDLDVVLPEDGDVREHEAVPAPAAGAAAGRGLREGQALTAEGLGAVRDLVLAVARGRPRLLTAGDVARLWSGPSAGEADVRQARDLLAAHPDLFEPDPRRPYRFRPVPPGAPASARAPSPEEVRALLEPRLAALPVGAVRLSFHPDERRAVVRFPFPDAAGPRAAPAIAEVAARTGWAIEVHPHPNQESLVARARAALPADLATGPPSLLFAEKRVRLDADREVPDAPERAAMFQAETGWTLEIGVREVAEGSRGIPAPQPGETPLLPDEVKVHLTRLFEGIPADLAPQKATFPVGEVVLHFVHPGMAARHGERLTDLARLARRTVRVHPHVNHQRLSEMVSERLPRAWEVLKPPAWVPPIEAVRIVVWSFPPEDEAREVLRSVEEVLGCRVVLERGD